MYEKEEKMCDVMWKKKSLQKNTPLTNDQHQPQSVFFLMFYDEQEKRSFDDDDN